MRGCSTNEVKKGEIGKMFLMRRLDVCALRETKLKGRGEVIFGEVDGQNIGSGWREGEGRSGPFTEWVVDEVCSGVEVGVIQAYVG